MYRSIILVFTFISIFSSLIYGQQKDIAYYIDALRANHPVIREYENEAKLSELDNKKLKAGYRLPSVYVTADLMKAPVIRGTGYDEAISNGALYSTMVNAEQPILNSSLKAETEKNNLQATRSRYQGQLSLRELEKHVTDQYIHCYTGQQHLTEAKRLRQLLIEQHNTGTALAKSGILKASDIILIEIELLNEDVHITELQSQFSNDLNILNGLCGLSDTVTVILDTIHIRLIQSDTSGGSFIYQFELDSMIAENSLKISAQKYKPQLSAFVNAGLNAIDPENIHSNWGFSAGIDLKMNLFDGQQQKVNRQQTLIQLETVDNFKRYFIIQRMQARQSLLKQIESVDLEMSLAEKQLDKYRTLLNIYRQGIINGEVSVIDYLTIVRTYQKTSDEYLNYNQQIQSTINAYNYWNW